MYVLFVMCIIKIILVKLNCTCVAGFWNRYNGGYCNMILQKITFVLINQLSFLKEKKPIKYDVFYILSLYKDVIILN
ncbi:hypothetical protein ACP275_09G061300 [Erythranthe tilingii]